MKDLTHGNIWRQILLFTLPLIGANLMMLSYQLVDSIIVGTFLGKHALAAVSQSYPVLFGVIALMIGLGSGTIVVISQYFGAKQYDKVQLTSDTIHIILIIIGFAIGILGFFISRWIFTYMGTPDDVMDDAVTYMSIYLGGIVFSFGFYTISSLLRGVGDSVTPLHLFTASSVLNIFLDIVLIAIFRFGVGAAAFSTIVSQAIVYFIAIEYINRKKSTFKINFLKMKLNRAICIHCLKYGLPNGLQQFLVALGGIVLMSLVSGFGTEAIAGYGAAIRIESIALLPVMNFSSAIAVFTGQNIGAMMTERLKKGLSITLIYTLGCALASTVLLQIFSVDFIGLFGKDPLLIENGAIYLKILSAFYPVYAVMFILSGYMKGSGAVRATVSITIISLWLTEIPLAITLCKTTGLIEGIWWAIPASWVIGCICMTAYYYSGRWHNKSVIHIDSTF